MYGHQTCDAPLTCSRCGKGHRREECTSRCTICIPCFKGGILDHLHPTHARYMCPTYRKLKRSIEQRQEEETPSQGAAKGDRTEKDPKNKDTKAEEQTYAEVLVAKKDMQLKPNMTILQKTTTTLRPQTPQLAPREQRTSSEPAKSSPNFPPRILRSHSSTSIQGKPQWKS